MIIKLSWIILILILPVKLLAQTKTHIERINFFPKADAFAVFGYQYEKLNIDTPQSSVMAKEVNNYKNLLSFNYAHRFGRKIYLGLITFVEEASENVVFYGIPLKRRFNSIGPREPGLFMIYRLREQQPDKGLVDLFLSYSPKMQAREIGNKHEARWNGRAILHAGLSHGMWEDKWEFRSSLEYIYYGKGEEKNNFTDEDFVLESYNDLIFNFKTQYRINKWLFVFGTVGVEYHAPQDIDQKGGPEREIQAGTGSVFQVGLKKPISEWSVVELSYTIKRNDYFVKATANNLEGELRQERAALNFSMAF